MRITFKQDLSMFGIQSVQRHLAPCKFNTASSSHQGMTAKSYSRGGEWGTKFSVFNAWGMPCRTQLSQLAVSL